MKINRWLTPIEICKIFVDNNIAFGNEEAVEMAAKLARLLIEETFRVNGLEIQQIGDASPERNENE